LELKRIKIVYILLMVLPLIAVAAALGAMPDQIPAHFGLSGVVNRYGSKYEALIFPIVTLAFGILIIVMGRITSKVKKFGESNEKMTLIVGLICLIFMDLMNFYFLFIEITGMKSIYGGGASGIKLIFGAMGVMCIVFGAVMPRTKMNSTFGLRTKWSMKDEETWKRSQKFGGITFAVAGALMIFVSIVTEGKYCLLWSMYILIAVSVLDIAYSFIIANYKFEHKDDGNRLQ